MSGRGTRITVDLGSEDLAKALKIAAVQQGRTVRDIVVEALSQWLERGGVPDSGAERGVRHGDVAGGADGKDYRAMLETLNRYRGLASK